MKYQGEMIAEMRRKLFDIWPAEMISVLPTPLRHVFGTSMLSVVRAVQSWRNGRGCTARLWEK